MGGYPVPNGHWQNLQSDTFHRVQRQCFIGRDLNRQHPVILAFWLGLTNRRCPSYLTMIHSCLHPKVTHGLLLDSLLSAVLRSLSFNPPCTPSVDNQSRDVGGRFHYCTCREGLAPSRPFSCQGSFLASLLSTTTHFGKRFALDLDMTAGLIFKAYLRYIRPSAMSKEGKSQGINGQMPFNAINRFVETISF